MRPTRADEQRILVAGGQQIGHQLLMEEHVAVEDDEAFGQQIAREPQGISCWSTRIARSPRRRPTPQTGERRPGGSPPPS